MATNMTLSSRAFDAGERIPADYTADGQNVSPPLAWDDVPEGTQSLALICDDPDAPKGLFTHWVAFNLPPDSRGLDAGLPTKEMLHNGTTQGVNSFGRAGYGGPSPPAGKPHHYVFHLYALDEKLNLTAAATREQVTAAMRGHILGQGELTGIYGRPA